MNAGLFDGLSAKEKFFVFVCLGAVQRDLAEGTANAQLVAKVATEIPEDKIPPNIPNAAKGFLNYCFGAPTTPLKWMLVGAQEAMRDTMPPLQKHFYDKIQAAKSMWEFRRINDEIAPLADLSREQKAELRRIAQARIEALGVEQFSGV